MYVPKHFAVEDADWIDRLIAGHPFAQLITVDENGLPFATHLPMLHDPAAGDRGTLAGHLSRGNPQWRHLETAAQVLAVFWGPHAYVSPAWYETAPAVPTWNYATVHVYGRPRLVADEGRARRHLRTLVAKFEDGRETPWQMDLPADFEAKMLKGIAAFEIDIARIEAKAKLSQNRPAADRAGVVAAMRAGGSDDERALAALMDEHPSGDK